MEANTTFLLMQEVKGCYRRWISPAQGRRCIDEYFDAPSTQKVEARTGQVSRVPWLFFGAEAYVSVIRPFDEL